MEKEWDFKSQRLLEFTVNDLCQDLLKKVDLFQSGIKHFELLWCPRQSVLADGKTPLGNKKPAH